MEKWLRRSKHLAVFLVVILAYSYVSPVHANYDKINVCNRTERVMDFAYIWRWGLTGWSQDHKAEGWQRVQPGYCGYVNTWAEQVHFIFRTWGPHGSPALVGLQQRSPLKACISIRGDFFYEVKSAEALTKCPRSGMISVRFHAVTAVPTDVVTLNVGRRGIKPIFFADLLVSMVGEKQYLEKSGSSNRKAAKWVGLCTRSVSMPLLPEKVRWGLRSQIGKRRDEAWGFAKWFEDAAKFAGTTEEKLESRVDRTVQSALERCVKSYKRRE